MPRLCAGLHCTVGATRRSVLSGRRAARALTSWWSVSAGTFRAGGSAGAARDCKPREDARAPPCSKDPNWLFAPLRCGSWFGPRQGSRALADQPAAELCAPTDAGRELWRPGCRDRAGRFAPGAGDGRTGRADRTGNGRDVGILGALVAAAAYATAAGAGAGAGGFLLVTSTSTCHPRGLRFLWAPS